jgi:hypothetical protein
MKVLVRLGTNQATVKIKRLFGSDIEENCTYQSGAWYWQHKGKITEVPCNIALAIRSAQDGLHNETPRLALSTQELRQAV